MATDASDYGVAGFDSDLLDAAVLKKHAKALDRATMLAALGRGSVAVKVNALQMLAIHGKITEGEAMSVGVMLKDSSASVRSSAARAMAAVQEPSWGLKALTDATDDADETVAKDIRNTVQKFGKPALPLLIAALNCDGAVADVNVLPHIVAHGSAATEPLLAALADDRERVRTNAVAGLMMLGPSTLVSHKAQLSALARDSSDAVRSIARRAMNAIYRQTSPGQPDIAPPSPKFADETISAADVKKLAKTPIETLRHVARDGRAVARYNAWRCVDAGGVNDDYTIALALVAMKDEDARVRATGCSVVTSCSDERLHDVIDGLVVKTLDKDVVVRDAAWAGLDTMKKRSLPVLVDLMGERDQDKAAKLVEALADHGSGATKALIAQMDHPGPIERWNAVLALTRIGGKELEKGFKKLVELLKEPFDAARAAIVIALGEIPARTKKDADVVDAIEFMLEHDASLAVRTAADRALRFVHGA